MLRGFKEFMLKGDLAYQEKRGASATTRPCPECTTAISVDAKRCPSCTATVQPESV